MDQATWYEDILCFIFETISWREKLPYQVGRIYFFDPVSLLTNIAGDNMELLCFWWSFRFYSSMNEGKKKKRCDMGYGTIFFWWFYGKQS